jgi:hypothetical protein
MDVIHVANGLLARLDSVLSAAFSASNSLPRACDPPAKERKLCVLELVGGDRPGLVSNVS